MIKHFTIRDMVAVLEKMDPMTSVEGLRDAHYYKSNSGAGIGFVKTGRRVPAYELRQYLARSVAQNHLTRDGVTIQFCGNDIKVWISCKGFHSDIAVTGIEKDGLIKVLTVTEIEQMAV